MISICVVTFRGDWVFWFWLPCAANFFMVIYISTVCIYKKMRQSESSVIICCFSILSLETFWHRDGRVQGADQMHVELGNRGVRELYRRGRTHAGQ